METFFNSFNSSRPIDLHSFEVASAINEILNESNPSGCIERKGAIKTLRNELSVEVVRDDGGRCEVCGSLNKVYPRTLSKGMVKSLAKLYRLGATQRPVTIQELGANGGDHAKLRFWGLVYQENDPMTGASKGWRVSNNGVRFLSRTLSVPKVAYLFQNILIGWSVNEVSVSEPLDRSNPAQDIGSDFEKFELQSLMRGAKGKIILCE